jgi:PEP-CTERM motif
VIRLLRTIGLALALLTFLFQPATAHASEFEFNGAGLGGMIIWDGDYAVSTSNNGCLFTLLNCETNQFLLTNPGNLHIVVNGPADTDLQITSLFMVLGLAPGTNLPACDLNGVDVQCGSFMDFTTLADLYNNGDLTHANARQEDQNAPGYTDPNVTIPDSLLVYLRMALPPSINGLTQTFDLNLGSSAFLADLIALNPGLQAYIGLDLQFIEIPNLRAFTAGVVNEATPAAVPEPGTMLLLGSGLAVAARRLRRRQ